MTTDTPLTIAKSDILLGPHFEIPLCSLPMKKSKGIPALAEPHKGFEISHEDVNDGYLT